MSSMKDTQPQSAVPSDATPAPLPKPKARSPRHRAREFALQGIYQWLVSGNDVAAIDGHMQAVEGFDKCDRALFIRLLHGTLDDVNTLRGDFAPHAARTPQELSPVEHAILLLAAFELRHQVETPYPVIINEAIELAKSYGGTDGHKFVNGVLDKMAEQLRAHEVAQRPRKG